MCWCAGRCWLTAFCGWLDGILPMCLSQAAKWRLLAVKRGALNFFGLLADFLSKCKEPKVGEILWTTKDAIEFYFGAVKTLRRGHSSGSCTIGNSIAASQMLHLRQSQGMNKAWPQSVYTFFSSWVCEDWKPVVYLFDWYFMIFPMYSHVFTCLHMSSHLVFKSPVSHKWKHAV